MPEFDIMHSTYIPSKAEMLNNVSTRAMAPDVPLLFCSSAATCMLMKLAEG